MSQTYFTQTNFKENSMLLVHIHIKEIYFSNKEIKFVVEEINSCQKQRASPKQIISKLNDMDD